MNRRISLTVAAGLLAVSSIAFGEANPPDEKVLTSPIASHDSVFIEELTWLEVAAAMESGKKTVIVPTGGVEQKGPYSVTGRHNLAIRFLSEAIARELGDALVAPVVPFVPEGNFDPPSGHMCYPGTISVQEETFIALLSDIAESMKVHGFREIVFIGDSGGNQKGMEKTANLLNERWDTSSVRAHYVSEYYDAPRWREWFKNRGIVEESEGIHDGFRSSVLMLLVDPMAVRVPQRIDAGKTTINGIDLLPMADNIKLAREYARYHATTVAEAIRNRVDADE